ncbi:hypothetical protein ACFX1Q_024963 [Malus domestica]
MVAPFDILNPISGSSVLVEEVLNVASFQGLDQSWAAKTYCTNLLEMLSSSSHGCGCSLHFPQEFLSMFKSGNIIMPLLLFCQDEREGRRWPEEVNKGKECRLKIGDVEVKQESKLPHFNENFPKLECPSAPWLGLLFTYWCHICQASEESHVDLDEGQMVSTHDQIKLAKFKPDGDLTITWNMQSKNGSLHCPLFVDPPMIMTVNHHHGHDQFHMDLLVWNTRISLSLSLSREFLFCSTDEFPLATSSIFCSCVIVHLITQSTPVIFPQL